MTESSTLEPREQGESHKQARPRGSRGRLNPCRADGSASRLSEEKSPNPNAIRTPASKTQAKRTEINACLAHHVGLVVCRVSFSAEVEFRVRSVVDTPAHPHGTIGAHNGNQDQHSNKNDPHCSRPNDDSQSRQLIQSVVCVRGGLPICVSLLFSSLWWRSARATSSSSCSRIQRCVCWAHTGAQWGHSRPLSL